MLQHVILLLLLGFSSGSPIISLPVGSHFTLQCLPDYPADLLSPEFRWKFAAGQIGDRVDPKLYFPLNSTEKELHLFQVKIAHSGTYECVTKGLMGEGFMKMKRTYVISVKETPPPPLLKWFLVIATEGEVVKLPCQPSVPKGMGYKAKWTKVREGSPYQEIKPVTKSARKEAGKKKNATTSRFHWAADPSLLDWSMEIVSLDLRDEGLYKCEVSKKEFETKTVLVELVVEKAPPPRCFNQSKAWEKCEDPENRSWKKIVSESMTAFSLHVYDKVNKLQSSSNLLFSPLSIAGLLSHLLLGSRGETREELERALSLPPEFSCIHSVMRKMKDETKDSITMATQMFYNPELTLEAAFRNQSQEFYDSVPIKLTNSSERNVKMINDWVARKTQNRITELLDTVEESTDFVLLNAVYFSGKWKKTFEVSSGTFTTFSGDLVPVQTLYSFSYNLAMNYIPQLKAQVAMFPLEGKSSLYILLPNQVTKDALASVEKLLTEGNVNAMVREMNTATPAATEVTLPVIKLLQDTDLITLLKKIGLSNLFEEPNLCGIFGREEPAVLTDARHRAFLSLTEKGVEAAAVSSLSYSRSFNTFSAMQPFLLMVWNDQINCPMFMGKVVHPHKTNK